MLCHSTLGQVRMQADRVGPCRPQVPGTVWPSGTPSWEREGGRNRMKDRDREREKKHIEGEEGREGEKKGAREGDY